MVFTKIVHSAANIFGVFREYTMFPTHDPEETTSLDDLSDLPINPNITPLRTSPLSLPIPSSNLLANAESESIAPFANWSIWALLNWMWTGSQRKSGIELDRLVHEVLLDPKFKPGDLQGFSTTRETQKFDKHLAFKGDGWIETDVSITVPDGKAHKLPSDPPVPTFTIPGLHHRSIVEVIRNIWTDKTSSFFHLLPFKLLWNRQDGVVERLHGELYTSDAFLGVHEELQRCLGEPGCQLERVVCALMFWSDSTHLASFGNASLWPLYMFFGNESKYSRCRPSSGACHHIAYIPKVCEFFAGDRLHCH